MIRAISIAFLFAFSIHACAQDWELLTPLKQNSDVQGCSFLDDQRGFAVLMTAGDIIQTSDGGMTWRRPWAPTVNGNLYDIEYVTEDTIVTCGSNGGLFRTTDGGNSWYDLNPPTSEWLYQLEFINSQIGIACGFNGTIIRTTNGGDSWQQVASGTTSRLWGIDFVNDTLGFIAGWNGTVLKTINSGADWTVLNTSSTASFQDITFVNDQIGYACGGGGNIVKTTNGGNTWTSQTNSGGTLYYIHFESATHGWAAGAFGMYYTTSNGGSSWNTTGSLGNNNILCGDYISPSAAFVMGDRQISKSTNNASTWTVIKSGVTNSKFNGMWFSNDNVGTVVGSVGVIGEGSTQAGIVQTSDGGQTWQVRNQGSSGGWWGVHFPTANTGYVVGGNSLAKTTNGGTSWTYTTPLSITGGCTWFTSEQNGVVGGFEGIANICHTGNGGTTFSCGTNMLASAIQFTSNMVGYAVHQGSSTTFFKTTDGGSTWENIVGLEGANSCLHFSNDNEGWVGSISSVWHTTDGGLNWTSYYAGGAYNIIGIHFYSDDIGFIVDNNANMFKTIDGGQTWELILTNYITMPGAISAQFTENYCYIGCYAGDIYRAELGCGAFTAGNITGDDQWCEGHQGILAVPHVAGAQNYEWTLPDGWSGATNSAVIQPIPGVLSGLVTVTITNACGLQSSTDYDVNVTPMVTAPASIIGPASVCLGADVNYSVDEVAFATNYDWSTTLGAFSEETNNLFVTDVSQSGIVHVRAENECGLSNWTTLSVGIQSPPTVTLDVPEDQICNDVIYTLTGGVPSGGYFSGDGVNLNDFDPTLLANGIYEISYHYSGPDGCSGMAIDQLEVISYVDSPANFNDDCHVDTEDLQILMDSFGCVGNCSTDLDGNNVVGTGDIMIFMGMMTN